MMAAGIQQRTRAQASQTRGECMDDTGDGGKMSLGILRSDSAWGSSEQRLSGGMAA